MHIQWLSLASVAVIKYSGKSNLQEKVHFGSQFQRDTVIMVGEGRKNKVCSAHCISSPKAKREKEVGLNYKTSKPPPSK